MRVPWTARSNQSILEEINPEYALERLMLMLKLQYFGHPIRITDSLEKTLMLGKCWGPASAGSRGTLRMNSLGEKRRERERPDWRGIVKSGKSFFFYHSFYILS